MSNQVSEYKSNNSYFCHHIPTSEDWYVLGIDVVGDRVCVSGWPATIGKLSDCRDFELNKPLTPEELEHRNKKFGKNWI